jgi:hypothetical protein
MECVGDAPANEGNDMAQAHATKTMTLGEGGLALVLAAAALLCLIAAPGQADKNGR